MAEEEAQPQPQPRGTRVRTTDLKFRVAGAERWKEGLLANRSAHKEADWPCDICQAGFTSRADYQKHLKTKKHQNNLAKQT